MTFSSYLTEKTPYFDSIPQSANAMYVSGCLLRTNEKLNDKKKCAVFGVIVQVTCSTHLATNIFY